MTQTTYIAPETVEALHDVEDHSKYSALIESMTSDGWIGAPVVLVEREGAIPLAITGSHRLAAAEFVGIEAPTVHLRDLFTEAGVDYDATIGEYIDGGWGLYDAVVHATDALPLNIIDYYGLDAH